MPLIQTSLNAGLVSVQALSADPNRVFLYLRNYQSSTNNIYVSFGPGPATAGTNGELELTPGEQLQFGANYQSTNIPPYYSNNCPLDSINIVTATGTALGCVFAISSPYFTP